MKLTKIALACVIATGTLAPQFAAADDDFEFHGYARFGTVYEADGNKDIGAAGQTGNAAGRLGNEGMGGEILFQKNFVGENGTKWDVGFMIEDWYEISLKQAYAGASNVFVAQPNAYIWAGRVFHSRVQQDLNDYYVVISDSQGAGIKNLELGFANLELGFVGGVRNTTYGKPGTHTATVDGVDNVEVQNEYLDGEGQYALTSKLSSIGMGPVSMDLVFNYGFSDDGAASEDADLDSAYLGMVKLSGWNQNFYARYSSNTENNVLAKSNDSESVYVSLDGSFSLGERTSLGYLTSYHDIKDSRTAANFIARLSHSWNDIHSTWIEAGTVAVDFDDNTESSASKITLSQNIAIGGVTWARPMLRFFVTAGTEEDQAGNSEDPIIVGANWEAWW